MFSFILIPFSLMSFWELVPDGFSNTCPSLTAYRGLVSSFTFLTLLSEHESLLNHHTGRFVPPYYYRVNIMDLSFGHVGNLS
jgi:hypothetical protein